MLNSRFGKAVIAAVFSAGLIGTAASVASAGEPVVQACVGTTFADAAAALPGGDLGHFIAGFARGPGGLGGGIQTLQAGNLPDDVAVNACN